MGFSFSSVLALQSATVKNSILDGSIAMPIPAERQERRSSGAHRKTVKRLSLEVQQFSIFKMTFLVGLSNFIGSKSRVTPRDEPLWK